MAAGMPVLGIAQSHDDEARIIEAFDAGQHVTQGDVEAIVEVVETWRTHPDLVTEQGENARIAFEEHFTADHSIDRYYQLLRGGDLDTDVTQATTARSGAT
jgi:glycosyltransferase involved in cell wall biosynthesis